MNGVVDDELRALISLPVAAGRDAERVELSIWIDTAFNGGLVIPRDQIQSLGLAQESTAEAVLADGSMVELETYRCVFDWFGTIHETQIVASEGAFPLLGTMLLAGHKLTIDYGVNTVDIS
mgnify:CR=1 FL=1